MRRTRTRDLVPESVADSGCPSGSRTRTENAAALSPVGRAVAHVKGRPRAGETVAFVTAPSAQIEAMRADGVGTCCEDKLRRVPQDRIAARWSSRPRGHAEISVRGRALKTFRAIVSAQEAFDDHRLSDTTAEREPSTQSLHRAWGPPQRIGTGHGKRTRAFHVACQVCRTVRRGEIVKRKQAVEGARARDFEAYRSVWRWWEQR